MSYDIKPELGIRYYLKESRKMIYLERGYQIVHPVYYLDPDFAAAKLKGIPVEQKLFMRKLLGQEQEVFELEAS